MANSLGFYNAPLFANEALIEFQKALGMATRVHIGYDRERRSYNRGEYININKPSVFVAQDAPGAAQDISPESTTIHLNQFKEVRMAVTDKELAYTGETLINDHIRPAAYTLANVVDQSLNGLYTDIPWIIAADGTTPVKDFTNAWQTLFDNEAPQEDLHYEINGALTNLYLQQMAFAQYQGAGDPGVVTQQRGTLGMKYNFEVFSNQNVKTHTTTAITGITQAQLNAAAAKGDTTVVIKDSDAVLAGALAAGDTFVIAGNIQRYSATAVATAAANLLTVNISPPLVQAYLINAAVTITQNTGKSENLAFHRGAFALAFAKLPNYAEAGNIGAQFSSLQDPKTGVTIRYRIAYDNTLSRVVPVLDVLYGVKTLNPNLAVRIEG